ncbi:substrate-binding domain-containing protein [Bythopirellula polymerisocia]|uniref:D-ribose-binding periplasmic protein n=1 Tax=Bythopirellula polymerisocia TaxID=2528003 RepID=A0A5C6CVX0_9BACT|nr:substrate-binding domain-containing protein [Bythopirellula polymerisocia]TWU27591.1 D-ribose-binding periplasmic protein precursor [Bythopirellula polymerisocia]
MSGQKIVWLLLLNIGCLAIGFVGGRTWESAVDSKKPAAGRPHFDFIAANSNPFWDTVVAGARAAADEYDVDLVVYTPSGQPGDQTAQLVQVEAQGSDGVAISPVAPNEQSLLLSRLATKTLLVTVDNDAPQSLRHCYVGTNNFMAGKMCAKVVQEALPEGGKIVVFIGAADRANAQERLRGFRAQVVGDVSPSDESDHSLEKPYGDEKWTVLQTYVDGLDPAKAAENVKKSLEEHPDTNCMVGLYSYNGPVCLTVLKERDKVSDIKIIAFDDNEETLDGIENGGIYATVVQGNYEYGYEAVRLLISLYNSNERSVPLAGSGSVYLPCSVVSRENVADHRFKIAERLADHQEPVESDRIEAKSG